MGTETQGGLVVHTLVVAVAAGVSNGHDISGAVDALVDDVAVVVVVMILVSVTVSIVAVAVVTAATISTPVNV